MTSPSPTEENRDDVALLIDAVATCYSEFTEPAARYAAQGRVVELSRNIREGLESRVSPVVAPAADRTKAEMRQQKPFRDADDPTIGGGAQFSATDSASVSVNADSLQPRSALGGSSSPAAQTNFVQTCTCLDGKPITYCAMHGPLPETTLTTFPASSPAEDATPKSVHWDDASPEFKADAIEGYIDKADDLAMRIGAGPAEWLDRETDGKLADDLKGILELIVRDLRSAARRATVPPERPAPTPAANAPQITAQLVGEVLQFVWSDWCADTGCIPDAFKIIKGRGRRPTTVEGDFVGSRFAEHVTEVLAHRVGSASASLAALERECKAWRWLHWDQPSAPWACPCGHALGSGLDQCGACDTLRPAKGRSVEVANG